MVGFGEEEKQTHENGPTPAVESQDEENQSSSYGNVSEMTFLTASPALATATMITDIRGFTSSLKLHPYHKILT